MSGKMEIVRGPRRAFTSMRRKCIHSRHCVLDRPDVFVPNVEGEWIHPDRASAEEIAALAANCPSGAITCTRHDGSRRRGAAAGEHACACARMGRSAFHAELALPGGERALRATLCRCGASAHKPYCDGSHAAAGFSASGEPPTAVSTPLAIRNGALAITPLADGPLKLSGALEVGQRHRPHDQPHERNIPVPLRRFGEQALLRRQPQADRFQGRLMQCRRRARCEHAARRIRSTGAARRSPSAPGSARRYRR